MSALAFHDALKALLEQDPTFGADISAMFGERLTVVEGARELKQIPNKSLPAVLMEQGDGEKAGLSGLDDESLTIGSYAQGFEVSVLLGVVWQEQDLTKAHRQRTALPLIFAQLMLRNPSLNGVNGAWVERWEPDRGIRHPMHLWEIEIRAQFEIQRN